MVKSDEFYLQSLARYLMTRENAPQLLADPRSVKLYELDAPLDQNTVVESINGPVAFEGEVNDPDDPPGKAYFIDDAPDANWEHPCEYVIVHDSGAISRADETAPPSSKTNAILKEVPLPPLPDVAPG